MADKEAAGPADESRDPSDPSDVPDPARDDAAPDQPVDETAEDEQADAEGADGRYDLDDPEALEELYRAESGGPDAEQLDDEDLSEPDEIDDADASDDTDSKGSGVIIDPAAPKRRQPAQSGTTGTLVKTGTKGSKGPTPARDKPRNVRPARTTPPKFVRESIGELRKVVYPTGQQVIQYFVVVLVFVLFIIAYVSLLDLGLGQALFKLFS